MPEEKNFVRPANDEARALAGALLQGARTAALAVLDPQTGAPLVSRIAFSLTPEGVGLSLLSDLALHTQALRSDARACLLLGDPGTCGDPLNQPRLSLQTTARIVAKPDKTLRDLRALWLKRHPKSKLYLDFADFNFFLFEPTGANLNGGFAKAYALGPNDLKVI